MSGNPFADLSEHNIAQIAKYLKFFRSKRDAALRSVDNEFHHIKQDKLNEDMFTKEEMEDFADFMLATVRVINERTNERTLYLSTTNEL